MKDVWFIDEFDDDDVVNSVGRPSQVGLEGARDQPLRHTLPRRAKPAWASANGRLAAEETPPPKPPRSFSYRGPPKTWRGKQEATPEEKERLLESLMVGIDEPTAKEDIPTDVKDENGKGNDIQEIPEEEGVDEVDVKDEDDESNLKEVISDILQSEIKEKPSDIGKEEPEVANIPEIKIEDVDQTEAADAKPEEVIPTEKIPEEATTEDSDSKRNEDELSDTATKDDCTQKDEKDQSEVGTHIVIQDDSNQKHTDDDKTGRKEVVTDILIQDSTKADDDEDATVEQHTNKEEPKQDDITVNENTDQNKTKEPWEQIELEIKEDDSNLKDESRPVSSEIKGRENNKDSETNVQKGSDDAPASLAEDQKHPPKENADIDDEEDEMESMEMKVTGLGMLEVKVEGTEDTKTEDATKSKPQEGQSTEPEKEDTDNVKNNNVTEAKEDTETGAGESAKATEEAAGEAPREITGKSRRKRKSKQKSK